MRIFILFSVLVYFVCASASLAQQSSPPAVTPMIGVQASTTLSQLSGIHVTKFVFNGNTAITSEELSNLARPYENRDLAIEDLESLRQELSKLYLDKGYINSGVIIPDQKVDNGILKLQVVEGQLKKVEIEGLSHYSNSFFKNRVQKGSGSPLNITTLQESLQLLQQDSRIKRINAELVPSSQMGEALLKVKVAENSPYLMVLRGHNDGPPSTGSYRGEVSLAHQNLLGRGDTLAADFGITEGSKDYGAGFEV